MMARAAVTAAERRPTQKPKGKVRAELAALGRRPRKRLAQHFLADPGIARRIVALAAVSEIDSVLEIGPGLGALTDELASRCRKLRLVEVDREFAARLRERFVGAPHVTVVEADVLKLDLRSVCGEPTTVVANLPYNISTPVLFQLLDCAELWRRIVVMLQREVAERLRARPRESAYGVLSVLVQHRAKVEHGLFVPAAAFVPRPRVESEVVVLTPHPAPPVLVRDPRQLSRVVRATFQQRRKQLANSLRAVTAEPLRLLARANIDSKRRPETLTLEEFARLAGALDEDG
jgi:16S rRNA (adenine1518-N6/adenine1519-N6)-dimethyltransferase